MVLQMPYPNKAAVFVASSDENVEQGRQEVEHWASGHGYRPAQDLPTFTIFRRDSQPREWVLLERAATDTLVNRCN